MSGMFAFVPAALFLALFGVSVRADRRRFRNAVYLGLTFIFTSVGLLTLVPDLPHGLAGIIVALVFLVPALGTIALGIFLIGNGLTVIRKEGRRPANLLAFMAGVGIFALIAFVLTAGTRRSQMWDAVTGAWSSSPDTSPSSSCASSPTPTSTAGSRCAGTSTTW